MKTRLTFAWPMALSLSAGLAALAVLIAIAFGPTEVAWTNPAVVASSGPRVVVRVLPSPPAQRSMVINIRAYIDGRSRLNLDDDRAWWNHLSDAAPGRHRCQVGADIEATIINGVEWFPQWPDAPDCENRNCSCLSDELGGVVPPIPDEPMAVYIEEIECRQECSLVEYPSLANGFRAVVEFNDHPTPDSVWYEINLVLEPCDDPANYCTSTTNSSGDSATIGWEGSASIGNNDAVLTATGCPPGVFGIFIYGQGEVQHSFGDGYLCISPFGGLTRLHEAVPVEVNGTASRLIDFPTLPPASRITVGSTWNFQFFFRDVAAGGAGFNLSDGLAATFCP